MHRLFNVCVALAVILIGALCITTAWRWSTWKEQRAFTKRQAALPKLPTRDWTPEEIAGHQQLFLEKCRRELQQTEETLQKEGVHWAHEIEKNESALQRTERQLANQEEFLRAGMAARKAGVYPANLFGEWLSREELEQNLLHYQHLRERSRVEAKETARLLQFAREQTLLVRTRLEECQTQLQQCGFYLKRLENKERVENISQLAASLEHGIAASEEISARTLQVFEEEHAKALGQQEEDADRLRALEDEFL